MVVDVVVHDGDVMPFVDFVVVRVGDAVIFVVVRVGDAVIFVVVVVVDDLKTLTLLSLLQ